VAVGARFIASGEDEEKAQGTGRKAQGTRENNGLDSPVKPENDGLRKGAGNKAEDKMMRRALRMARNSLNC